MQMQHPGYNINANATIGFQSPIYDYGNSKAVMLPDTLMGDMTHVYDNPSHDPQGGLEKPRSHSSITESRRNAMSYDTTMTQELHDILWGAETNTIRRNEQQAEANKPANPLFSAIVQSQRNANQGGKRGMTKKLYDMVMRNAELVRAPTLRRMRTLKMSRTMKRQDSAVRTSSTSSPPTSL